MVGCGFRLRQPRTYRRVRSGQVRGWKAALPSRLPSTYQVPGIKGPLELGVETESFVGQVGWLLVFGFAVGSLEGDAECLVHIPDQSATAFASSVRVWATWATRLVAWTDTLTRKPQVSATTCGSPWALSGAAWVAAQDLPWTPGARAARLGPGCLQCWRKAMAGKAPHHRMIWSGNPLAVALPPIAIVGRTSQVGSFVPAPNSCTAASGIFIRSHVEAGPSV